MAQYTFSRACGHEVHGYQSPRERNMQYQFWVHKNSGEIYAVRTQTIDSTLWVTGLVGPLHYNNVDEAELPHYHYDDPEHDFERGPAEDFYLFDYCHRP